MLLVFMIFWALFSATAGLAAFRWAKNVESEQRSHAVGVAGELTRFLGRELEQYFVPLYPLRLFVQKTRLIHLARVAESFPGSSIKPSPPFRNTSATQDYPEIQADFDDVVDGIWQSLDPSLRASILSLQVQPRGIITMVSPRAGNEGVIGLEVIHESRKQPAVLDAIGQSGPSVVGPLNLIQGAVGILAYLPVFVDEDVEGTMETQEIPRIERDVMPRMKFWGFVTAVANLTKMAEWSGAMRDFEYSQMHFQMKASTEADGVTETHTLFDSDSDTFDVDVEIPRLHWTLSVGWSRSFWPAWFQPAVACAILGAAILAGLITLILLSRKKHRLLLYRIMPRSVVKRLQQGRQVVHAFDPVSIFFSDLVGFTDLSSRSSPLEVVSLLNEIYTEFDKLAKRHQVFKSDTIGDAYMVVGGAPERCGGPEGAARVTLFALEALEMIESRDMGIAMRAGIASGPVVAAVVGTAVPKYSFFGETVGTANAMESSGKSGRLQVTELTKNLLEHSGVSFHITEAHDGFAHKNCDSGVKTYWVSKEDPHKAQASNQRQTLPVSPLPSLLVPSLLVDRTRSRSPPPRDTGGCSPPPRGKGPLGSGSPVAESPLSFSASPFGLAPLEEGRVRTNSIIESEEVPAKPGRA